jgi:hypothetical protein
MVAGAIPYGAPKGTRFDVNVRVVPGTSTESLDNGGLMETSLRFAAGGVALPGKGSKVFAEAKGPVFVNPYAERTSGADAGKLKEGTIIGGGRVTRSRPIRLQLRDPDYAMAQTIQNRINERFGNLDVAKARTRAAIELHIPRAYADDYTHFLDLVMHIPLANSGAAWEMHAREVVRRMEAPGADREQLALVLEAMNRQVLPVLRPLYASRNAATAYYAARTGVRLGDELAAESLLRFAQTKGSPYQVDAIEEIGRNPQLLMARHVLTRLLDDPSDARVRVAAYEALMAHGDHTRISRTDLGRGTVVDVVRTAEEVPPVIYATRSRDKRIVLFGGDLAIFLPVFYSPDDEMVTISGQEDDKVLRVFRRVPRGGGYTPAFQVAPRVVPLLETLGSETRLNEEGKYEGLRLTYAQLLRTLAYLTEEGYVSAKLILQQPPEIRRILQSGGTVGRPEMPVE